MTDEGVRLQVGPEGLRPSRRCCLDLGEPGVVEAALVVDLQVGEQILEVLARDRPVGGLVVVRGAPVEFELFADLRRPGVGVDDAIQGNLLLRGRVHGMPALGDALLEEFVALDRLLEHLRLDPTIGEPLLEVGDDLLVRGRLEVDPKLVEDPAQLLTRDLAGLDPL